MSGIKGKEYPYTPNMVESHIHCINGENAGTKYMPCSCIGRRERERERETAHIM